MNNEILLFVSNILTGTMAWFVGRGKQAAETDNQVLRNLELSINLYKGIIDDLREEITALNIKIQELEKKINDLHDENKRLRGHL
jgi:predicted  nucleic acid-binding Zn-ribbon protein